MLSAALKYSHHHGMGIKIPIVGFQTASGQSLTPIKGLGCKILLFFYVLWSK